MACVTKCAHLMKGLIMDVKEKVILESIKRIEKRIPKLEELIFANPLSEILDLRIQASEILKKHKGDYIKMGALIEPLAAKEKRLFKAARSQTKNAGKWIHEQVDLQQQLYQLKNELFTCQARRKVF